MKSNIHATSNVGTTSNCNVSSGSATTTSQILTVGNCTPISVTANPTTWGNTYTGGFTTFTDYDSTLPFTDYLKEDELEKLLDIFQERMSKGEEDNFKCLIQKIVQRRHCSEAFILKYLDMLTKFDIFRMHKTDIVTGAYPSIALKLECEDK